MIHDPLAALEDDPIGDTVHQPFAAFDQGDDAAQLGHSIESNPYPIGCLEHDWWNQGWHNYHETPPYEDYDDDGDPWADDGGCSRCNGEGFIVTCPDDMCRGQGECFHGDGHMICPACGGREWT